MLLIGSAGDAIQLGQLDTPGGVSFQECIPIKAADTLNPVSRTEQDPPESGLAAFLGPDEHRQAAHVTAGLKHPCNGSDQVAGEEGCSYGVFGPEEAAVQGLPFLHGQQICRKELQVLSDRIEGIPNGEGFNGVRCCFLAPGFGWTAEPHVGATDLTGGKDVLPGVNVARAGVEPDPPEPLRQDFEHLVWGESQAASRHGGLCGRSGGRSGLGLLLLWLLRPDEVALSLLPLLAVLRVQ